MNPNRSILRVLLIYVVLMLAVAWVARATLHQPMTPFNYGRRGGPTWGAPR